MNTWPNRRGTCWKNNAFFAPRQPESNFAPSTKSLQKLWLAHLKLCSSSEYSFRAAGPICIFHNGAKASLRHTPLSRWNIWCWRLSCQNWTYSENWFSTGLGPCEQLASNVPYCLQTFYNLPPHKPNVWIILFGKKNKEGTSLEQNASHTQQQEKGNIRTLCSWRLSNNGGLLAAPICCKGANLENWTFGKNVPVSGSWLLGNTKLPMAKQASIKVGTLNLQGKVKLLQVQPTFRWLMRHRRYVQ